MEDNQINDKAAEFLYNVRDVKRIVEVVFINDEVAGAKWETKNGRMCWWGKSTGDVHVYFNEDGSIQHAPDTGKRIRG